LFESIKLSKLNS